MFEANAHMRVTQLRAHGLENAHCEDAAPDVGDGWVVVWQDETGQEYTATEVEEVQEFVENLIAQRDALTPQEAAFQTEPGYTVGNDLEGFTTARPSLDMPVATGSGPATGDDTSGPVTTPETAQEAASGEETKVVRCQREGCMNVAGWRVDWPDGRSEYLCSAHREELESGGLSNGKITELAPNVASG